MNHTNTYELSVSATTPRELRYAKHCLRKCIDEQVVSRNKRAEARGQQQQSQHPQTQTQTQTQTQPQMYSSVVTLHVTDTPQNYSTMRSQVKTDVANELLSYRNTKVTPTTLRRSSRVSKLSSSYF